MQKLLSYFFLQKINFSFGEMQKHFQMQIKRIDYNLKAPTTLKQNWLQKKFHQHK